MCRELVACLWRRESKPKDGTKVEPRSISWGLNSAPSCSRRFQQRRKRFRLIKAPRAPPPLNTKGCRSTRRETNVALIFKEKTVLDLDLGGEEGGGGGRVVAAPFSQIL